MLVLAPIFALFLAATALAQDTGVTATEPVTATATVTGGVKAEPSSNPNWNATWFSFPNRGEQGYWVDGTENIALWTPVDQPTYLRLSNSNTSLYWETQDLGREIVGGQGNFTAAIYGLPAGNNYILTLCEEGTNKKLAQSQGFRIRPNGSVKATPSVNTAPVVTGNVAAAGNDSQVSADPSATSSVAPEATTPGSGAQRLAVSLAGVMGAVVAFVAVA